ncbi:MAG TPA: MG2 domain-containing protein, partial [Bacillota bacterium]|nr:MG2 domain-containing protein [Bacillota bacterium]
TNFTFIFSGNVVPKSQTGQFFTMDKIQFKPAVPGKYRWDNPKTLRFFPEVALRPSTAYIVVLSPDIASPLGKRLIGERTFKFTTERFKVVDQNLSFAYNPKRQRGLFFQARLNFNYPVSVATLQRSLKLNFTDNRQSVRFTVHMLNGGREALIASELLIRGDRSRRIELSLPAGFLCQDASIGLKNRYARTAEFRKRQALVINDLSVETESGNKIIVRCSEPVDPDTAENFISIKPATKFRLRFEGESIILTGNGLKPGETYNIKVAKGIPALNGIPLAQDFNNEVTFPDLEPSVSFNSSGRYLSNKGHLNLGLETVNLSRVEVEIAKIYANNLANFLSRLNTDGRCYSEDIERLGRVLTTRQIEIRQNKSNEVVTTPLHLGEYLNEKRRGIFQVSVCDPENRWREANKVVIVTDLGILAKLGKDELVVWVNSLDDLSPKAGTKITLVSYNNQEMLSGVTDAEGVVRFSGMQQLLKEGRPYLILAEQENDFSFICFEDSQIDKTDFPVDGRENLIDGYEAFVYTDRGVYRPGEQANIVSIVRGASVMVPQEFPLRMEIVGPDGMVFREYAGNTKNSGVSQFKFEIPDYAKTGKYTANLLVAKEKIGGTSFNVEEFMPARIKVETLLNKERFLMGDSASITVKGMNLFGPPASGRRVTLSVRLQPAPFSPPNFRSYNFGESAKEEHVVEESIGQDKLDENGLAKFTYDFPDNFKPTGMVRAVFQATVTEDGGRSVSNFKSVEYHPHQAYLGVKVGGDYYAKVGEDYTILLAAVDPSGKTLPETSVEAEIYSVTWNSIYRRDSDGNYSYHSEREEEKIDTQPCKLNGGQGSFIYRPKSWGCFKVVFIDRKSGARNSCEFYVTDWGYAPWAMDHPDRIELDLDKKVYKAGETATLQIKAPFAGRAMVTIEREKIYDVKVVELKGNTGVISIPVKEGYKPNVYISVQVIRTTKKLDKRAPTRAFGTIPLCLDNSSNQVKLSITAPEEIRPSQTIEVQLDADGLSGESYVTLAAVDEGICLLTEYQTPDPLGFFYGKRALDVNTYDLYGMLLPEVESVKSPDTPGGDGADEGADNLRRKNLNPVSVRRVKPVSLWSGLVKLDGQGRAKVKWAIPSFNGTLRLMAVAVSGSNFGSTTKKMLVRDPIVLTSTYPRFMAPGDRVVIPVAVSNGTGGDGPVKLRLTASGPVTIDGDAIKEFSVPDKQERMAHFAVVVKRAIGQCSFHLEAQLNGKTVEEDTELAVRSPQALTRNARFGVVTAKKPQELNLHGGFLPGTGRYTLCLASMPTMKFVGGIKYLLGYPYGCVEQTTSKVFPLLYFSDLARFVQPDLANGNAEKN